MNSSRAIGAWTAVVLAFAAGFGLAFVPLALGLHAQAEWVIVSASFLVTLVGLAVILGGLWQLARARADDAAT